MPLSPPPPSSNASSDCSPQTVNTGITVAFLRLLQKYVSILLLIAKIDDRRTVAALYSSAHEVLTGTGFVLGLDGPAIRLGM